MRVSVYVCENVFTSLLKARGWPSLPQLVSHVGLPGVGMWVVDLASTLSPGLTGLP